MCVCSEVSRTAEIAEALQNRLDAYKAEKRELGSVSIISIYHYHTIHTPSIHNISPIIVYTCMTVVYVCMYDPMVSAFTCTLITHVEAD